MSLNWQYPTEQEVDQTLATLEPPAEQWENSRESREFTLALVCVLTTGAIACVLLGWFVCTLIDNWMVRP